jgi:formylmethanofuran dehydrogenase subunit E
MERRKFMIFGSALVASGAYATSTKGQCCTIVNNWYLPTFLEDSKNNITIKVRDTDSALGRYNAKGNYKEIKLEDVVKFHGHMCDGVVFAFLQISVALNKLFPDGIVDRTDLVGVAKNSPCLVDALAYLTGAKINFQTLRIDGSVGGGHIVQKVSTKEAYHVAIAHKYHPTALKKAEKIIKNKIKNKEKVLPQEIDKAEKLADDFIKILLNTSLDKLVDIEKLSNYTFLANSDVKSFGRRGDTLNKNVPRHN